MPEPPARMMAFMFYHSRFFYLSVNLLMILLIFSLEEVDEVDIE